MLTALKPLGGHAVMLLLVQLALLLLVARLGAELAKRVSLPPVVGELAAGIFLGPSVFGHFGPETFALIFPAESAQFNLLEVVGTLGMVLLLLLTGLETDLRLLRNLGRAALIASAMGMVIPFATGFGLGMFMPAEYLAQPDRRLLFAVFLATAMAISAMPVIAKILMDLDLIKRNIGVVIMSAGVVDDTVGWLILSVIAGVATRGEVRVADIFATILLTLGFVAAAGLVLYPLCRRALRGVSRGFRTPNSDLVFVLVVTLLCAALTEWIGVHAVFGAFVAGTVFRQIPELRGEVVQQLEGFVFSVLAPVFFGIVGLKVDLWSLGGGKMLALVLAIACLGKLVGCTVGSIWGGLRFWEGLSIAVAMNARGAMELVVATIGLSLGILNQQMFSIIVVVAIVTSFMAPVGLRLTMRKVRVTDEEQRRILASRSRPFVDPERVRVLVPIYGQGGTEGALRLAAGAAGKSGHKVEVVSVHEPISWAERLARLIVHDHPKVSDEKSTSIQKALVTAGLALDFRELGRRDVAETIVNEARKGIDLIVLGAPRKGDWLGGDVLEEVVRQAPCHVVIVRAGNTEDGFKRLLVPFDGGVLSRVAVEFAVRYSEATEGELTIAVAAEPKQTDGNGIMTLTDDELERIAPVLRTTDRRPKMLALDPRRFGVALVNEARSKKYDLVLIGAENRAIEHRLFFGTENERLIREAPVPVAIVVPNIGMLR